MTIKEIQEKIVAELRDKVSAGNFQRMMLWPIGQTRLVFMLIHLKKKISNITLR